MFGCTPHGSYIRTDYIDNGTVEQKKCLQECKNTEMSCKLLAETQFANNMNSTQNDSYILKKMFRDGKNSDIDSCESDTRKCFEEICNGKVKQTEVKY